MRVKLNEKNMYSVMGKINTFFKKDVKLDEGIKKSMNTKVLEEIYQGIYTHEDKLYDSVHVFSSYSGYCQEHWIRKEDRIQQKNGDYRLHKDLAKKLLLAISSKFYGDSIPLSIGDIVEFHGNRLDVISMEFNNKSFIQMDVSQDELVNEMKHGISGQLLWFTDDSMWIDYFKGNVLDVISVERSISETLYNAINEIDFSKDELFKKVITTKEMDDCWRVPDDFEFTFIVDLAAFKDNSKKESFLSIEFRGEKCHDIYPLVDFIMNGNESEKDDDESDDSCCHDDYDDCFCYN